MTSGPAWDKRISELNDLFTKNEQVVDQFAEATLRLLGVPADQAARLAALPIPDTGSW